MTVEGSRPPGTRVIVIGAGIAGLAAAHELKRLGHEPLVLEAQNRVGGRIYTLRDFAPGLYAEAGAMRIPRTHDLTLEYCRRFDLPMRQFVTGNLQGLVYVGGERLTIDEATRDPARLPYDLADRERGRTCDDLWEEAIAEFRELVERDGDAAWEQIVGRYDQYSLYEFLQLKGWSEGAIEY